MKRLKQGYRQFKKLLHSSDIWLPYLLGLSILLVIFQLHQKIVTPKTSLRLRLSRYRKLIPYIEAMAKLETGNYSSAVYKVEHNLFGMHVPRKRKFNGFPSGRVEEGESIAAYSSNGQSIQDFINWMKYTKFPTRVSNVYEFADQLKQRGYYSAPFVMYAEGLRAYLNA